MAEVDIDQDFLMRFSCMGTQDKDVLISELHRLLDAQLSREGCEFFLDMTNWNLQAAVGAFYDYYSNEGVVLPEMTLSKSSEEVGGAVVSMPPNSVFTETWTLTNTGTMPWPIGVRWALKTGGELCSVHNIPLPLLPPGGETTVTVQFHCPLSQGLYHCQWRACTSGGALFGDPAWVIVRVEGVDDEDGMVMSGLVNQLATITTHEGDMEMEPSKIPMATVTEDNRLHPHIMATNPFIIPPLNQEHSFGTGSMMTSPDSIPTGTGLERLLHTHSSPPSPHPQDSASAQQNSMPQHNMPIPMIGTHFASTVAHADSTSTNCSILIQNQNTALVSESISPSSAVHSSPGHMEPHPSMDDHSN